MADEEVRETLLNKKEHQNCPGCKVELHKAAQTGLPIKELFTVWVRMKELFNYYGLPTNSCFSNHINPKHYITMIQKYRFKNLARLWKLHQIQKKETNQPQKKIFLRTGH
ncbi:hypothetical protein K7X08_036191 [Anisodus acutangulus]|uniref:Uncharacterized protein n=1 Tax=Anisodus acutangulus TaxID=402998 RepID=A0A9Q1L863_9SOLA|nr:hypothetical protein K7X08_036191 [Anisodus acutangulus]